MFYRYSIHSKFIVCYDSKRWIDYTYCHIQHKRQNYTWRHLLGKYSNYTKCFTLSWFVDILYSFKLMYSYIFTRNTKWINLIHLDIDLNALAQFVCINYVTRFYYSTQFNTLMTRSMQIVASLFRSDGDMAITLHNSFINIFVWFHVALLCFVTHK